jgi:hypothetical protein
MSPAIFEWSEKMVLKWGDNKLSLFFDNDPEASRHGYIRGGEILDKNVIFINDIQIGMSAEGFYKKFFDYIPIVLTQKYKVIKLESCVTDITHIYTFDKGLLSSIKFISE